MDKEITSLVVYIMDDITSYDAMKKALSIGFNKVCWNSNSISYICDGALIHIKVGNGFTKFSISDIKNTECMLDKISKIMDNFMSFVIYYSDDEIVDARITNNPKYMEFVYKLFCELIQEKFEMDDMAQFIAFTHKKREVLKSLL